MGHNYKMTPSTLQYLRFWNKIQYQWGSIISGFFQELHYFKSQIHSFIRNTCILLLAKVSSELFFCINILSREIEKTKMLLSLLLSMRNTIWWLKIIYMICLISLKRSILVMLEIWCLPWFDFKYLNFTCRLAVMWKESFI